MNLKYFIGIVVCLFTVTLYGQSDSVTTYTQEELQIELIPKAEEVRANVIHGDTASHAINLIQIEVVITLNIPSKVKSIDLKIGAQEGSAEVLQLNDFSYTHLPSSNYIKHVRAVEHYIVLSVLIPDTQLSQAKFVTVKSSDDGHKYEDQFAFSKITN